jgi:large subunit ribosomal protein L24
MKIKKGDLVQMLSGKDRGKQGRVLEAQPARGRVIVENLNMIKRHTKPRPIRNANSNMGGASMTVGGIVDKAAAVPIGNVMVVCPTCKLPTRIGYRTKEVKGGETVKVRYCKRAGCGEELD